MTKKKFLCDAPLMYMYLVSIFKANIFLRSARSHEELALFSLNNITLIIQFILLLLTRFLRFCLFLNAGFNEVFEKTGLKRLFARNLLFSLANNLQIRSLKGNKHPGSIKFNLSSIGSGLISWTDRNIKTQKQHSLVSMFSIFIL